MIKCCKCHRPLKATRTAYDEINNVCVRYRYCPCGYMSMTYEKVQKVSKIRDYGGERNGTKTKDLEEIQ